MIVDLVIGFEKRLKIFFSLVDGYYIIDVEFEIMFDVILLNNVRFLEIIVYYNLSYFNC